MMTLMLSVLDEVVDGMSISFAGVSCRSLYVLHAMFCHLSALLAASHHLST
jgi:hypothetical protein